MIQDVTEFSPSTDEQPMQQPSALPPLQTYQPSSQNLVSNLHEIKKQLLFVKDKQQIVKLKEMLKEINFVLSQNDKGSEQHLVQTQRDPVSDNRKITDKNIEFVQSSTTSRLKSTQDVALNYKKIECNLQRLFMFYIDQFPSTNGHYEKRFIETAQMSMQMFMVFAKQFNILGHDAREPQSFNTLEQKRRGQIDNVPEKILTQQHSNVKVIGIQPFSSYKKQLVASYQKHYEHVSPKHKWWVDNEIFKKFYKPNSLMKAEGEYPYHKKLDSKTMSQFFKKHAFESKSVNYEQFKSLLTKLAVLIFPGQETDPTQRILTQVLFLHKTKKMKSFFHNLHHAFDIVEKVGYRYESPKEDTDMKNSILENRSSRSIPKTTRNSVSTNMFSSQLMSPTSKSGKRILSKYTSRADEVEQQEGQKEERYKALFENIYSMKLSSQVRSLRRGQI